MKRSILITGGAGFIGHHVVEHILKNTDWRIVILDRLSYAGNLNRIAHLEIFPDSRDRIRFVYHDLRAAISKTTADLIGKVDYILHLAAESHVDKSIEDPIPFVMSNVLGTTNLLIYTRDFLPALKMFVNFGTDEVFGPAEDGCFFKETDPWKPSNPYSASKAAQTAMGIAFYRTYGTPVINTFCHDSETNILTEDGIKQINGVKVGDLVWVLKNKSQLALEPINRIVNFNYTGEMVEIRGHQAEFCVTPDHRMLAREREEKDYSYIAAEKMISDKPYKRYYLPLYGNWVGKKQEFVKSKVLLADIKIDKRAITLPELIPTKTILRLLGWYISEGSIRKGTVQFGQKDPKNRKEIKCLLESLGLKVNMNHERVVITNSKPFADLLSSCGTSSEKKKIPKWALQFSGEYLRDLFESLMLGDGSYIQCASGMAKVYYTTSQKLAEQFCELCLKLEYSPRICKRMTSNPAKTKERESYIVRIRKGKGTIESRQIKRVPYHGKVWCVGTKSTNFFIERNGLIACSGNTMNNFGERQHPEKYLPKIVLCLRDDEILTVHGTEENVGSRIWLHARNTADAVLFLLKKGVPGESYNIVGQVEMNNLELAQQIAAIMDRELRYKFVDFHATRPGHDRRYALDGSKLSKMGWEAPVPFHDSLVKTVNWMMQNHLWLALKD